MVALFFWFVALCVVFAVLRAALIGVSPRPGTPAERAVRRYRPLGGVALAAVGLLAFYMVVSHRSDPPSLHCASWAWSDAQLAHGDDSHWRCTRWEP